MEGRRLEPFFTKIVKNAAGHTRGSTSKSLGLCLFPANASGNSMLEKLLSSGQANHLVCHEMEVSQVTSKGYPCYTVETALPLLY